MYKLLCLLTLLLGLLMPAQAAGIELDLTARGVTLPKASDVKTNAIPQGVGQFALSINPEFFDHTELLFNYLEKNYAFVFPGPVQSSYTSDSYGYPIIYRFYSNNWGTLTYYWQYTDQEVYYTANGGRNWYYFGTLEEANTYLCEKQCWGTTPSSTLNETEVRGIVDGVLKVVGTTLSGGLSDQLQSVLGAALSTSSTSTCPKVTNNAPGGINLSNPATLPSPLIITVDYGAGCRLPSTISLTGGSLMSGSAKLTLSNLKVNSTTGNISASFSAEFNSLRRDTTLLGSGSVSGSLSGSLSGNTPTGSANLTLSNFLLSSGEAISGTIAVQITSTGDIIAQTNTQTSKVTANLDLRITPQNDNKVLTINSRTSGTANGYSVDFTNVVFNTTTCPTYPVSGQIKFGKAGKTATVTFNSACNGSYTYK